ncbi:conserved hypothetical protein [Coccidioides posadasii str. Silveira]|uniref:Uncharacterized protein n=1 Tax=Coccidioides posadasii (strain RMSCC 757 / Silveira) TaxID=443226 RepID=E9D8W9_COCPS|nr:conserved hypothetical protein [Coccidioides posadasii str. Silveira]
MEFDQLRNNLGLGVYGATSRTALIERKWALGPRELVGAKMDGRCISAPRRVFLNTKLIFRTGRHSLVFHVGNPWIYLMVKSHRLCMSSTNFTYFVPRRCYGVSEGKILVSEFAMHFGCIWSFFPLFLLPFSYRLCFYLHMACQGHGLASISGQ